MKKWFTEEDRQRIQEAVAEAEGRTSGEIVPYVAPRSDTYEESVWKGAVLAAGLALALAMAIFRFHDGWVLAWLYTGWGMASLILAAGLAGGLSGWLIPSLKRVLAGRPAMIRAVHRHAMKAFVEEEVFDTRERTGILIFISLLEHRIEVLGDAGINAKVTEDEWTDVVGRIRNGIRSGHLADGLVEAIRMCGELLERSGVERREDDANELSDALRFREDR